MSNEKREELRIPEEAAKSALCACYFGLLWDLYYIQNTTERDSTVSDVNQLKVRLGNYMEVVQEIMLGDSALLREEAFLCICDILINDIYSVAGVTQRTTTGKIVRSLEILMP